MRVEQRTYSSVAPLSVDGFWVPATCGEVSCIAYTKGWTTLISERDVNGRQQADLIRQARKGQFTETKDAHGQTTFHFPPGSKCFGASGHRRRGGRPPLFVVKDSRSGTLQMNGDDWVDSFSGDLDRLKTRQERG